MNLRRAKNGDLERVVQIYNSSVEWRLSTADLVPVSVDSKFDWFDSHTDDRPLYVYEDSTAIYGWASIQPYNERPAYDRTIELSIYIDHASLGHGHGSNILSLVIKALPRLNVKTVVANIYSHNEASIKLFTNFGFVPWGTLHDVCNMDGKEFSVSILGYKVGTT